MEILAVLIAVTGVLWGVIFLTRGGLPAGLLIVLFTGTCLSLPFFKVVCGPIPLTIDRIAMVLLVGQYVLWRRWGLADPKPWGRAEVVLVLLLAYMALSTLRGDWSVNAYQTPAWFILYYAMPFGVYWIARNTAVDERWVVGIWTCLAVFGGYLAVTMIAEYYQQWWLVFPKYIVTSAEVPDLEWVGRGRGPLLHPIGSGMLAAICLAAALLVWQRRQSRLWPVMAPVALLLVACIYFSLTRSVWMGGLLTVAIVVGLQVPARWRLPTVGLVAIGSVVIAATFWQSLLNYKRDKHLDASMAAQSAYLRPVLAAIAWQMFLDRPLMGCGYGQYIPEHENYTADRSGSLPLESGRGYIQHNVFLSMLAESGLIGLGLFLSLLGIWTRDAWRLWHTESAPPWARQQGLLCLAVIGAYGINGMFHDMSAVAMANTTLFFLAGLTAALRPQSGKCDQPITLPAMAPAAP